MCIYTYSIYIHIYIKDVYICDPYIQSIAQIYTSRIYALYVTDLYIEAYSVYTHTYMKDVYI